MKPLEAIRCTQASCSCECFSPGKICLRYCDSCNHGWVAHALDKLGYQQAFHLGMQVEVVQPNIVFDIASLMLYGSQATPVRLKILLDRLFSVLQHEEVLQVLHGFGWSYEDYARGYILQAIIAGTHNRHYENKHVGKNRHLADDKDSSGRVLDKWSMATRDEEHVILQQFLRFGETKAIAQEIILQDTRDKQDAYSKQTSRAESEIKKFIERSNLKLAKYMTLDPGRQVLTGALPFVPGARILTSPMLTPYSSSSSASTREAAAARPLSLTTSPATASTPLTTQPISRLQAYEFRRELASNPSPAPSPSVLPDKVTVAAPTNLAMSVPTVVSSLTSGRRSPVLDSPRNLSTTPSSVHSAPSPSVTPHKAPPADSGDLSGDYSGDSDDDQSVGAIDYCTRDSAHSPPDAEHKATAASAAARHLRKSNNPIKRQWIPSANFGSSLIGPNGKKRVLCTACNKTFCDKGALKIHYSAVHLKEMHKCTVDGCNMMFSSRRSRNRHSANPNPKLHMPQKRKELEGLEDEPKVMSSMSPSRSTSMSTSMSSTSPNMVVAPALVAAQRTLEAGGLLRADPSYFLELGAQFPFVPPPEKRVKLETQEVPTDLSSSGCEKGKPAEEEDEGEENSAISPDAQTPQEDAGDIDQDVDGELGEGEEGPRGESNAQRGGSRRKSNAPTRCTKKDEPMVLGNTLDENKDPSQEGIPSEQLAGGGAEQESPATVSLSAQTDSVDHEESGLERGQQFHCQKDGEMESSGGTDEDRKGAGAVNFPQIASLLLAAKEQRDKDEQDDSSDDGLVINGDADEENEDVDDEGDDDVEEEKEEGSSGGLTSTNHNDNDHNHNTVSREGEGGMDDDAESCGSVPSPSNEGSEGSVVMEPGSEVYLSKDNPRKCALCGKLFQNQFSVKIHFQNVHLKLMHGCTVDGCSAAFPSKRSRDRHSSNLNLHRKMMSGGETGLDSCADPTLRDDILTTLYGANQLAAASALNLQCNGQEGGVDATPTSPGPALNLSQAALSSAPSCSQDVQEREEKAHSEPSEETGEATGTGNGPTNEKGSVHQEDQAGKEKAEESGGAERVAVRREEPVCMSRKPVCCGMTFHTESALKEHYSLSHPSQTVPCQALPVHSLKPRHAAATETLLSSRRPRHRPKHKNGLHRLVSTGRKNGFS